MKSPVIVVTLLIAFISVGCSERVVPEYNLAKKHELDFNMEVKAISYLDRGRLIKSGRIETLLLEQQVIELASDDISDGHIKTKHYGEIRVVTPDALQSDRFGFAITNEQRTRFLTLVGKEHLIDQEDGNENKVAPPISTQTLDEIEKCWNFMRWPI